MIPAVKSASTIFLVVLGMTAVPGCSSPGRSSMCTDGEFVSLFDGTSMDGWEIFREGGPVEHPDAFAIADDGSAVCNGYDKYWWRYVNRRFGDFVLRLEFKISEGANSGVVLRSRETKTPPPPFTGFEVQIIDDLGEPPHRHSTGAIYDIVTPMYNMSRPVGEWNDLEITVNDTRVVVVLNDRKVIDTDFAQMTEPTGKFDFAYADMPRTGYIAIQDHGSKVWFRNIRIKPR